MERVDLGGPQIRDNGNRGPTRTDVLDWLDKERGRQCQLYGEQVKTPQEWLALLIEELGEAAQQINHGDRRTNGAANPWEYQDQLLHIAAVAVAALEDQQVTTLPTCLQEEQTIGGSAEDCSPYPPFHFHRKLAGYTMRELQSEIALRWAFGIMHARETNPGEGSTAECEYLRSAIEALRDDVIDLEGSMVNDAGREAARVLRSYLA